MSHIDDFIEASETDNGPVMALFGDPFTSSNGHTNGYDGIETMRLETGYVSTGFGQVELPIFVLDYVQFQLPAKIVDMAVSNNILVIALNTFRILRIDLDNPLEVEDIEITRKPSDGKIIKLFFDPTGRHLIITTDHEENYYLYEKWRRTKQLNKLKGISITSIGWNKQATLADPSTREILIGTKKGLIYETVLEPTDEFFRREERYLEQVYSIHESTMPITGLHFEQFPVNNRKYFVMATTPTRIYQFVGFINPSSNGTRSPAGFGDASEERGEKAIFASLFSKYEINPGFQELPGELPYSEVHFFSRFHEIQQQGVAQTFAWLTSPGIYHGDLIFGSQNVGDSVIDNVQLVQYPSVQSDDEAGQLVMEFPISVALTEFHFILLYKDRMRAICQLNDQIVYEEMLPLNYGENVIGMAVDDTKKTFWVYTSLSMYELVIKNEERDVWKLYLEKKQYNMALQYCKDPAQKDKVYTAQAKDYFGQRRFQMSAKFFAESTVPFEEVSLKFIEQDEMDALRIYLGSKLARLQKKDRSQKTMLATWLVEIYLSKLDELDNLISSAHSLSCNSSNVTTTNLLATAKDATNGTNDDLAHCKEQQEDIVDEFRTFIESHNAHLHAPTTFSLLKNHGRNEELLFYATLIGDYEQVINYWIMEKNWKKALEVLSKQNKTDIFYRFSPVLMENEPYETVNIWMRQPNLNPRRLIPALLRYDHSKLAEKSLPNQAIRYLSFVVSTLGSTDAAIHNFLLTLYAIQSTQDETALLAFLKNEGREMHYNLDYALRLCSQNGRTQSCVHIYSQMGLYEEAVNLALKNHDIELACINADKPEDDDALRKKLWLTIAKQVVAENKDIKSAMSFLAQCDLLQIDDVLPFFSEFLMIGDFKDDICTALEDYNNEIEDLKMEMDEATKNSDNIRVDIRDLRSR
ncbi:Pep3/Vps18/deep orange family-domain-containing protein [Halteromyces radiatus]|uniref:Pep3/Vps18/deep orange family-domain-containing protein n=1 Tax=Halteromyces radiatus TaxID=101107 RepID=UPI00221F0BEE|nr:Pep3/Vps18/deep orange family-domain-containing protein [Halteromyces radiatus]KAI8078651.1 Pep3/Vps18/deep orange family-domain-containing protein [Halteromyces radiatus]